MKHSNLLRGFAFAAAIAATALTGAAARANPIYLGASAAGVPGIIDLANGEGSAGITGVQGYGYTVSLSATGSPALQNPNFASNTLSIKSTGAGTITLYASELNNSTVVPSFQLGLSNNPLSDTSVTESVYADAGNGKFALTTLLGSATLTPGVTTTLGAPFGALGSLYSLTQAYTITFGANGGTVDATIIERAGTAVPEPASIAMLGLGLAGLGFIRSRRNTAAPMAAAA